MRKAFGIRDLTEGALMVALTMVIIICSVYIPGFSMIGMLAACVPVACLSMRRNVVTAAVAVAVCSVCCVFITHSIGAAVELTLMMILPGMAAGVCFSKRANFFTALFSACFMVVLGMIYAILVWNAATDGQGILDALEESMTLFEQTLRTVVSNTYGGIQKLPPEEIAAAITQIIAQVKETVLFYFPSALLIFAMVLGYLQIMLCAFVIKRTRSGFPAVVPFNRMKAPKSMCYLTVVLFLLSLFMTRDSVVDAALMNVNTILYFIIGVCGFSFIDAKVAQKIPGGIFRVMIYVGAIMLGGALIGFLLNGLILLGMLDSMVDFRRLGKAGEDDAGEK